MAPEVASIEDRRLELQALLDAVKSHADRNRLGQFATPTALATEILRFGVGLMPRGEPIRFLDPAIGTGSFYSALRECAAVDSVEEAKGFEVDPHYGVPAKKLWRASGLRIELADFTAAVPPRRLFNLVICNPPYVRHHHLDKDAKARLLASGHAATGISLSGLAGLYCHFMLAAHKWMAAGAVAGWLIPSEFMDVNYGREIKRYLLSKVTLLRIHRFDPAQCQFGDALVSSAVVWLRNESPPPGHTVEFTFGGSHDRPGITRHVPAATLGSEAKWTRFPAGGSRADDDGPVLADYFSVKRGIATGGNKFFIMTRQRIRELELPMSQFRPILPSPRFVEVDEIAADANGDPVLPEPLYLLDCRLPEEAVRTEYPALARHFDSCRLELASRYICSSRTLWYRQDEREPATLLSTYMGRPGGKSGSPFRFILNHSRAIAANTYLMLYPRAEVAEKLRGRPRLLREVWLELNAIRPASMISEGRVYGGGLHKVEPKELGNVPVPALANILGIRHTQQASLGFE